MKSININRFDGMADDYLKGQVGEFSLAKHFDTTSYPWKLQPLRGMSTDTASTGIGNIIVASSDGLMYGSGEDGSNPGNGKLWQKSGYGNSDVWQSIPSNNQLSGASIDYSMLVQYPQSGSARNIFWSASGKIMFSDPLGASSADSQTLVHTTMSQGFVHPKDKILYFGYQTSTATYIGLYNGAVGGPSGGTGWNTTALQLPKQYRVYSLTNFGDYLAIGCASTSSNGQDNTSVVFLWDRDTTLNTISEIIPWSSGSLKVLNNLGGYLVGVSTTSTVNNYGFANVPVQDYDSVQIKIYGGGAEPTVVKEITAQHNIASSAPVCTINERVNFIYKNRLYFSVNIVPNDGTTARYGLWSFGKSRTGRWVVNMERVETNTNTGTGVIACAITGDFVSMAHTSAGTLTFTTNGSTSTSTYGATSVYESTINPDMADDHVSKEKKLYAIYLNYLPIVSGQSIVVKYKVDALTSTSWTTVGTISTVGSTGQTFLDASGTVFTDGKRYEFRIESVGGAVITDWGYRYDVPPNQQ